MARTRKGFVPIFVLGIIVLLLLVGSILYWENQSSGIHLQTLTPNPATQNTPPPTKEWALDFSASSTVWGTLKKQSSTVVLMNLDTGATEEIQHLALDGYTPVENGFVAQEGIGRIYYLNTLKRTATLLPAEIGYGLIEFVDRYDKNIFYYSSTDYNSSSSFPKLYRFNLKTNKGEAVENEEICCSTNTEYKGQVGDKIVLRWEFGGGRRGYSSEYGNIDTTKHTFNRIVNLGDYNPMCPDDNYDEEGNCNVPETPGSSDADNLVWFGDGNSMLGLQTVSSTSPNKFVVSLSTVNLIDGSTHAFYSTTFISNQSHEEVTFPKDTKADVLRGYDNETLLFSDANGKLKLFNALTQRITDAPLTTPRDAASSTETNAVVRGGLDLLDFQKYKRFIEIPGKGKIILEPSDNSIRLQNLNGDSKILIQNASSAGTMFSTGNLFIYSKIH